MNIRREGIVLLVAFAAATSARAADVRVVYYDISGNTTKDLVHEMEEKGPVDKSGRRFPAYTEWRVSWVFRYESSPASCKLTELTASVEGTMTLPHWVDAGSAPAALAREWQNYVAALRVHENGHYAHGVQAANEIRALANSIQPAENCSALSREVADRAQSVLDKFRAVDETYDRQTNHGQTQGAVLTIDD